MSDKSDHKELLDIIGEEIMETLPEQMRTEENASLLGSICGFATGWFLTQQVIEWFLPKRDDK